MRLEVSESEINPSSKPKLICGVICESEAQFQRMAHVIKNNNREFEVRPILVNSVDDWIYAGKPRLYLPNDYHIDYERVGKLTDEIAKEKNICPGELLLESRIVKDFMNISNRVKDIRKRMIKEKFDGIGT